MQVHKSRKSSKVILRRSREPRHQIGGTDFYRDVGRLAATKRGEPRISKLEIEGNDHAAEIEKYGLDHRLYFRIAPLQQNSDQSSSTQ